MKRWLYRQLALNRAGLSIVVALCAIAAGVGRWNGTFGVAIAVVAAALAVGALKFFAFDAQRAQPPGRLWNVDGVRLHLFAEGRADRLRPVIWIAGGHGEGLVMAHLHRAIRDETRSILFDRAGAGWSGFGRLPLTIGDELRHLRALLEAASEPGPFVLAGHSFGGLFALNFAHRYPALVAGVVAMDPTSPANITVAGPLSFHRLTRTAPWRALALQLGWRGASEVEIEDPHGIYRRCLEEWAETINRNSLQPRSVIAESAAFEGAMAVPYDVVSAPHALGDMPLTMLLANPLPAEQQEMHGKVRELMGFDDVQEANFWAAIDASSEGQLQLSRRARRVLAPEGSSHMFPYEHPDFVLDEVRRMISRSAAVESAATDSPAR